MYLKGTNVHIYLFTCYFFISIHHRDAQEDWIHSCQLFKS